jgi:hypothetical protein
MEYGESGKEPNQRNGLHRGLARILESKDPGDDDRHAYRYPNVGVAQSTQNPSPNADKSFH